MQLAMRDGTKYRNQPFTQWPIFNEQDEKALIDVLHSGQWGRIGAQKNLEFEKKFSAWVGSAHGISCINGTTALEIAMAALGIGRGDEVIIPGYTFIATATAVMLVGATPVIVDIDLNTYNMCPESFEKAITPKTKAVIPVHIAGCPANLDKIIQIAKKHNLKVVEDSAQAHGAEWKGKRVGIFGDLATFSFQSSKNLSSGEGGFITTNNPELADLCWSYMNCGRVKKGGWYDHPYLGWNYRLTEFQAALLLVQLERLDEQMKRRDENSCYLTEKLKETGLMGIMIPDEGVTRSANHLFIMKYKKENFKMAPKEIFVKALFAEGIPCSSGYVPLYKFSAINKWQYRDRKYKDMYLLNVEKACNEEAVWLPQTVLLGNTKDMDDIVGAMEKIQKNSNELL